jgi:hypothetical protein
MNKVNGLPPEYPFVCMGTTHLQHKLIYYNFNAINRTKSVRKNCIKIVRAVFLKPAPVVWGVELDDLDADSVGLNPA